MDRLFLDANVLFAAAWRPKGALQRLWKLDHVELLSSEYAIEETRRSLETPSQRGRLTLLLRQVRLVEPSISPCPGRSGCQKRTCPFSLRRSTGEQLTF